MRGKIYFGLLVAILSEAITAFSKDNDFGNFFDIFIPINVKRNRQTRRLKLQPSEGSSNLLFRKKRIIDHTYQRKHVTLRDIPYIVNIRTREISQCGGSILSPNIILTAAHCVFNVGRTVNVMSDSNERHNGYHHVVKHLQMHPNYNTSNIEDDLALLYIEPAINLVRSSNRKIQFYNGPLEPGTIGTLSGWGCTNLTPQISAYPQYLQATEVPLISSQECHQAYGKINASGEKNFCTFHTQGQKGACRGDDGGPLAINGKLAGVLSGYSLSRRQLPIKNKPDFYVNLAYPPYRDWIVNTMLYLERIGPSYGIYRPHETHH